MRSCVASSCGSEGARSTPQAMGFSPRSTGRLVRSVPHVRLATPSGTFGIEIRAGLHAGECELIADKVGGIAVHTGARISAAARAGEVLVSSTVRDLVAGSGIRFEDRGEHELKGVGAWRLYSVVDA
jgi:class 3 adenylate cyclase